MPKRKPNDPRDYCRICNHSEWLHTKTYFYCCGREPREYEFQRDVCPCKEYIPSDNLKYLEYLYDKKAL